MIVVLNILIGLASTFTNSFLVIDDRDFTIAFDRIDNLAEIVVNDSLIYSSGAIDFNPDLEGSITVYLGSFLTNKKDKVVIKLYNGHEPYQVQDDSHWELKYVIFRGDEEYETVWEYADDRKIGLVFEEVYYL